MSKDELIAKQQLEIEDLKTEVSDIKNQLNPILNEFIMIQQYCVNHDNFKKMSMGLVINCCNTLSDIVDCG